uniref:Autotransporter outer membrane beta-barrel domain-containing protein n=1 Tax=Mesocestoides corti TaxID=53468 RepID=A0A5K3F5J2_MESCO
MHLSKNTRQYRMRTAFVASVMWANLGKSIADNASGNFSDVLGHKAIVDSLVASEWSSEMRLSPST